MTDRLTNCKECPHPLSCIKRLVDNEELANHPTPNSNVFFCPYIFTKCITPNSTIGNSDRIPLFEECLECTRANKGDCSPECYNEMVEERDKHIGELIDYLADQAYPTTQIVIGTMTAQEYVKSLAEFFAEELFDRRIGVDNLIMFAELGVLLANKERAERLKGGK